MDVHGVILKIQYAAGDIGAVVGDPLKVGQDVRPDDPGFHAAFARLHPLDVVAAQGLLQLVNDLLQRLYHGGRGHIPLGEGLHGQGHDLRNSGCDGLQLPLGPFRVGKIGSLHPLGSFQHVDAVIADPLIVA